VRCLLAIPVLAGLLFPPLASAQFRTRVRTSGVSAPGGMKVSVRRGSAQARRNFIEAKSQSPVISKVGGAYSIVSPFRTETRSPFVQPPTPSLARRARRADWRHELRDRHSGGSGFLLFNTTPFGYPYLYSNAEDASLFYPSLWPPLDQQYIQAWQIAHEDLGREPALAQNAALSSQVQALTAEVESLRQGATSQAPAASQAALPSKSIPTVFVYLDGRSIEVRNYAIFNQTLWVFSAETTRRIPLSAINLPATLKLNEDRGIDVSLPNAQ
jgi:hypothetical protein